MSAVPLLLPIRVDFEWVVKNIYLPIAWIHPSGGVVPDVKHCHTQNP